MIFQREKVFGLCGSVEKQRKPIAIPLPSQETGRAIAASLPFLLRGGRLYCLDGGNLFNPYRLTQAARAHRLEPGMVLKQVFISRAFTCYQLAEAADGLLSAEMARHQVIVVFLGIDALFLDEDISLRERRRLFQRILDRLSLLHSQGLPIMITLSGPLESDWAKSLAHAADLFTSPGKGLGVISHLSGRDTENF